MASKGTPGQGRTKLALRNAYLTAQQLQGAWGRMLAEEQMKGLEPCLAHPLSEAEATSLVDAYGSRLFSNDGLVGEDSKDGGVSKTMGCVAQLSLCLSLFPPHAPNTTPPTNASIQPTTNESRQNVLDLALLVDSIINRKAMGSGGLGPSGRPTSAPQGAVVPKDTDTFETRFGRVTVRAPSTLDIKKAMQASATKPQAKLRLEHIHGYYGMKNTSNNVYFTASGDVAFFAAGVGVVANLREGEPGRLVSFSTLPVLLLLFSHSLFIVYEL